MMTFIFILKRVVPLEPENVAVVNPVILEVH